MQLFYIKIDFRMKSFTPKAELKAASCRYPYYTIDDMRKRKCEFWFSNLTVEKLPDYMALLAEFYGKKNSKTGRN